MTVVVVDPALEADAALVLGSELVVVEELVGEGAVEALCFAVHLEPIRPWPGGATNSTAVGLLYWLRSRGFLDIKRPQAHMTMPLVANAPARIIGEA